MRDILNDKPPTPKELEHYLLDYKDNCTEYLDKVSYPIDIKKLLYKVVTSSFTN